MEDRPFISIEHDAETDWQRDRRLIRKGFKDLEYLPRARAAWNATLAVYAYSVRRRLAGRADLNLWAAMHGVVPSGRYERLGSDGLVLWHGTSAARADKIRAHGLFRKRGVWAATEPRIAHGFTRHRSRAFGAGSAMVVLLVSKSDWEGRASRESPDVAQFHDNVPRECIEYILWSDRIEFLGGRKAATPRPWGPARFKKARGCWVSQSRPPVRLDAKRSYRDLDGWVDASLRRIFEALPAAAAIEIFSSLYATIDPWEALEHERIFDTLERLCGRPRQGRGGIKLFSLANGTTG